MSSFSALRDRFEQIETPFYYYDLGLLNQTVDAVNAEIAGYPFHVHYALKANVNKDLLPVIRQAGFGADCVSGNEILRALETGFDPSKIVFAGVGKSDKEIKLGIEKDIFAFNVESLQELQVINDLAKEASKKVSFSLRVNPNVDAGTHEYITTGTRDNKFGITIDELWEALDWIENLENVSFIGLHFHIGSQVTDLTRFKELITKINELELAVRERNFDLPHLNVGGGLGIDYDDPDKQLVPDFKAYFDLFKENLALFPGQKLHFELGRSIVGQSGSLVSRVLYTKKGEGTTFLIIDAGMTELLRPALYKTPHRIESLSNATEEAIYDVVGPICETTDAFDRKISLPQSERGDLIVIRSAGAYAEVMSSRYNLRDVAPSVFS